MTTVFAAARIAAASSGLALLTARSSLAPAAEAFTWPKAPNNTFVKERFMALHMMTERMKPEAPSRAPATIRTLLLRTKPRREAEKPAEEFKREVTVGMSV